MNKTFTSLPGTRTVGNYIISKNLGEGTFGKVKLGIHTQTQEKVAIKILEKNKITDVADVERVTREINILKQVRHPNIIQLYQIIETPKQLFLVMEYVSQGELFEYIVKKKRLKEAEACEFFQQIISGVEYLHELGIVHRDLKPQNLLIDFNRRLKLVDFGLSNTYSTKTKDLLKTACGSPCYAAPEMIAGKKYEGLNADIWSCGVILYAMVCGYLPFQDPNTSALYKKIIAGQFTIPKSVSPSCKELLRGILTTDPNRRYTLNRIKQHQWFKQLDNKNPFYNDQRPPIGILTSKYLIPIDQYIIDETKQFESVLGQEQIKKYIANNRHNHTVTTYYLLLKKNLRLGINSPADICSNMFDQGLLKFKVEEPAELMQNMRNGTAAGISTSRNRKIESRAKQAPQQQKQKMKNQQDLKMIDSIDLDQLTKDQRSSSTQNRQTITARTNNRAAINRINLRDYSLRNQRKKKDQSVDFKLDIDNLPLVMDSTATGRITAQQPKRKKFSNNLNQPNPDKNTSINFYDIEETFRATTNFGNVQPHSSRTPRQPIIPGHNKTPISFRTSLDRYQTRNNNGTARNRYISLDVSNANQTSSNNRKNQTLDLNNGQANSATLPTRNIQTRNGSNNRSNIKQHMNKTFGGGLGMGIKMGINNDNIPKWSDQSERIRSILNKTITGHGTRKKKASLQY